MDNATKLVIYQAQVQNVRSVQTALKHVHRLINSSLRQNDRAQTEHLTKIYALMFCTWAEANFLKVIHTPHGLELYELEQIKASKRANIVAVGRKLSNWGFGTSTPTAGASNRTYERNLRSLLTRTSSIQASCETNWHTGSGPSRSIEPMMRCMPI